MAAATAAIVGGATKLGSTAYTSHAERKAGKAKQQAAQQAAAKLAENAKKLRQDIQNMTGVAESNIMAGGQAGLGALQRGREQQMGLFQGGNVAAQEMIRQSQPQYQNLVMGLGMPTLPQAYRAEAPNLDYQLPDFLSTRAAVEGKTELAMSPEDAAIRAEQEAEEARLAEEEAAKNPLNNLVQFTKSDFKDFLPWGPEDGTMLDKKTKEAARQIMHLTPEQKAELAEMGPSAFGLGGKRGTRLYQQLMTLPSMKGIPGVPIPGLGLGG